MPTLMRSRADDLCQTIRFTVCKEGACHGQNCSCEPCSKCGNRVPPWNRYTHEQAHKDLEPYVKKE